MKLESLRSCLNGLSQDSGVGSSHEFPSLQLEKIVVPPHLTTNSATTRKRQHSESSLSEYEDCKKRKVESKKEEDVQVASTSTSDKKEGETGSREEKENGKVVSESVEKPCVSITENKELCILCNINPKNSIFLHGNIAHMCSCYKCAMRTWGTNKRCPVCNCKVRNVVKVFTI